LHLRLKDYYAKAATHGASEGAGDGIISLLMVAGRFLKEFERSSCRGQVAAGAYKDQTRENGMA
jgi:hypothetical protein